MNKILILEHIYYIRYWTTTFGGIKKLRNFIVNEQCGFLEVVFQRVHYLVCVIEPDEGILDQYMAHPMSSLSLTLNMLIDKKCDYIEKNPKSRLFNLNQYNPKNTTHKQPCIQHMQ